AQVNFSNQLLLHGVFGDPEAHAGEGVTVALSWQVLRPTQHAYKVAVALTDEQGRVVSNRDILLMDERHRYTFRWEAGLRTTTYHVVPVPLGTPPGQYRLAIQLYEEDEETGQIVQHLDVLDVAGNPAGQSHEIGSVHVRLPRRLADPYETLRGIPSDEARPLGDGLTLRGALLPVTQIAPGERLPVVLLLSAEREALADEPIAVEVARNDRVLGAVVSHAGNGRFPTSAWRAGFPVLERRFVLIPPETSPGSAVVQVRWGGALR
ncbi:MAG: hypothetical protein NZ693_10620, partial [Thermoflexales bacterium]|nr:hypothetical protein [Thermoflexales bacterium]